MKSLLTTMLTGLALWVAASSAMARNTTYLDLKVDGTPKPGHPITLTATLSGGPFVLNDPRGYGRGLITIYDGDSAIASIEPSASNSPGAYVYYDAPLPNVVSRWWLSRLTIVSTVYTLPSSLLPRNFIAKFDKRGDDIAESSTSPIITVKPENPSIVPALNMMLDLN